MMILDGAIEWHRVVHRDPELNFQRQKLLLLSMWYKKISQI